MATLHLTNNWQLVASATDYAGAALKLQGFNDVTHIMIAKAMPAATDLGIELTETYRPLISLAGVGGDMSWSLYARAGSLTPGSQATLVVMPVPGTVS